MSYHLPPEISTQILTNLPVKSLVRFRFVSKTWYSLISSPNFISDHTARTLYRSTGDRVLLLRRDRGNCLYSFSSHDESFVESHEHSDLLQNLMVKIVGSCDGLICLTKHSSEGALENILIWNPSIRKLVELPLPRSSQTFSHSLVWGFGFDSESRDYKVVRIGYTFGSNHEHVAEIDIFDLRKGVWRTLSSPSSWPLHRHSVYLHGNLHWIDEARTASKYIVKSFNLFSEVFHEMEAVTDTVHPPVFHASVYPRLFLINGMLSTLLLWNKQQGGAYQNYCSVWSMKEYGLTESWTKLFSIEMPFKMKFLYWNPILLLRLWETGEVLLAEQVGCYKDRGDFLALYNPVSRKSIALLSTKEKILDACFYKESLVLL